MWILGYDEQYKKGYEMSEEKIVRVKLDPDNPQGLSEDTLKKWDAITDEDIEKAAASDPDAPLLTEEQLSRMVRRPNVKAIRESLSMTQKEFADTFGIPLRTLQEWEQNRRIPDFTTMSYLRVIAKKPDAVKEALNSK